ncbi:hypothetical protein [Methylosinus sp. PW1]|uniref:hypothetical protein n=1 Tax=Methylosinus sp. PW1 TaxID=107636 RepID=UPI000AB491E0|nr:hypothetical protein [Methylosinus sp. PW1]
MRQIPFLDVRDGGPIAHATARIAAAEALRDACLAPMPRWGHVCLAPLDRLARSWLQKSASRYFEDLERIAEILGFHGAATLNMSYLFACTTQAFVAPDGSPTIRRSLDWPFRGLGRGVEIAWAAGTAGGFYNVTWPGAIGVLTAMAPGRFSAVINQAPMRRRVEGLAGFPYDFTLNLANALKYETGWPPDHLLRYAFETCATFEEAVALLAREPLARPVLFTLTGTAPHEIALIERTEREANVLRGPVIVANDWQQPRAGWRGRMGPENNEARRALMRETSADAAPFAWAIPPVLNHTTRLVVEMSSSHADGLAARGYECAPWRSLPEPATMDFRLGDGAAALAA